MALCGAVLLALFSVGTFLYNLPQGPLRAELSPALRVMEPWLAQNWSFFAPDPPNSDVGVLVRWSEFAEGDDSRPFLDITTPQLEAVRNTVIPARESRLLTSALDGFQLAEDSLLATRSSILDAQSLVRDRNVLVDDALRQQSVDGEVKREYLDARQLFAKAVTYFLEKAAPGSSYDINAIQIRIVTYYYPQYEARNELKTDKIDVRTLPWWSVQQ